MDRWDRLICIKMKTTLTAYRRLRLKLELFLWLFLLLCCVLVSNFNVVDGWKCLYKEFPVDAQRIKGVWWIYGTNPEPTRRCYFKDLDLYWTRITQTDYNNFAVELHCSLPWFRHQMAIYTRAAEPSDDVIGQVEKYLKSVSLSSQDFHRVDKQSCSNLFEEPIQRWHLSRRKYLKMPLKLSSESATLAYENANILGTTSLALGDLLIRIREEMLTHTE